MRTSCVAALLVMVSAGSAGGQQPVRQGAASAPRPSMRPAEVRPSPAPGPLPAPHRSTEQPPGPGPTPSSPFDAGPFTYAPRYATRPWTWTRPPRNRGWGSGGFFVPNETVVTLPTGPPPDSFTELSASGGLELAVEPRSADVYVDGFYVGTVDDVTQNGLLLRAGRHWIDLRAEGYETLTVPVSVAAGQAVRYRGELVMIHPPSDAADAPRGQQTIYVIRGCYAGNRPPAESALPRGCDIANLRTLTPR
jgi:hypothetical protein